MRLWWLVACAATACVRTGTTQCGDEVCPAGTTCVSVTSTTSVMMTRCAQQTQLDACDGIEDNRSCSLASATSATCFGGACFPDLCGDALRGDSEACDDANTRSGDGCASDCRSAEVCGNGVVDPVILDAQGMPAANEQCDDNNFVAHDGCSRCVLETPRWTLVPHQPPPVRAYHLMATDSRRHEMLMFGGVDPAANTPNETWVWNGESWHARVTDIMPPGRVASAMTYDSARDRVIVFAGADPSFSVYSHDLWEYDGTRWEERVAAGPSSREEHAMTYDSIRKVTVLFGGLGQKTPTVIDWLDETWLWDGTTWTLHQPASPAETPPAVSRASLAFDPVRGESVVFGGSNAGTAYGETWLFDGTRWRRATPPQSPSARVAAAMAWDPTSRRVILFGGLNNGSLADAWAWDGTTWTPLPGGPPARMGGAMTTDVERGGVVMYGGVNNFQPDLRDTWWWDGTAWHDNTRTFSPTFLAIAAATDLARDVIVSFGGQSGATATDATLEYVRGSWFQRTPATRPAARRVHQMVYMPSIGKVVVWAGTSANGTPINDGTWGWDGTTWERLASAADTPPRIEMSSTYDAERQEIVMYGGRSSVTTERTSDVFAFDGATWTKRTAATSPPPRANATLGYDPIRKRVVMTSGQTPSGYALDLWTWDGATWTEQVQTTRPPARGNGSLIWSPRRQRLLLVGGFDLNGMNTDDVWELDNLTWYRVNTTVPPRSGTVFVQTMAGVTRISATLSPAMGFAPAPEMWRLRWESDAPDEVCTSATDVDGDGLVGCADPDCDERCTGCGDGTCSSVEDCHVCPQDCGACVERCGDHACSQGESAASCPGDC